MIICPTKPVLAFLLYGLFGPIRTVLKEYYYYYKYNIREEAINYLLRPDKRTGRQSDMTMTRKQVSDSSKCGWTAHATCKYKPATIYLGYLRD